MGEHASSLLRGAGENGQNKPRTAARSCRREAGELKGLRMHFIQAFFDTIDDKIAFLSHLCALGRHDEAMTLCCTYIDGLGQAIYWRSSSHPGSTKNNSSFNFVRVLREHGEQPYLDLIHPMGFIRWLRKVENRQKKFKGLPEKIESALQAFKGQLMKESDLLAILATILTPDEIQFLSPELWHSSLAHIAYNRLRSPFVHSLSWYSGISFDKMNYEGAPVPEIDFSMLYDALKSISSYARQLSERYGSLFREK